MEMLIANTKQYNLIYFVLKFSKGKVPIPKKENILTSQIVHIPTSLQKNQLRKDGYSLQVYRECPKDLPLKQVSSTSSATIKVKNSIQKNRC